MSKLNGEAKEWKPNATAAVFVPKTSAPAPQLNTNAPVWQAPQGGFHSGATSFAPQQYPGHMPYPQPVFDPHYMYSYQPNMLAPNMGAMHPVQGGGFHKQGNNFQNGGNNNHHNKKTHNNNGTQNKSNDSSDKSKGTKNKVKADSNNNEEPKITFGNLDESDAKTENTATATVEKEAVVEKEKEVVKEKAPEVVNKVEKVEEKSKPEVEKVKEIVVATPPAVAPVAVPEAPKVVVEEKKSEQSSGWKRNVDMVEKTAAQMLLRSDGVTRYGKSQLCSMNSWSKSCPEEIKLMYLDLAKIERPPMCETTRQKSPHNNHKGNNNNHHKGHHKNKNNQPEEPHPDELKIFSSEHLKSDKIFGGGRPDKVVDTTSSEGIVAQANFILNVMTVETFDKMSDKFMKVGLESEELMKMAVDLIVSKAQLEEHFSFMYAELCKKITDQWVTSDGEEGSLGKQFRLLLLKRCQEEFEQDRDAAVQEVLDLKLDRDDEEEKLLILKKRYTGHMRFVGEIYMKDMLKANKMHYCVTELLESRNEDGSVDEEKFSCLCKLFQTIGRKLEEYELKKKRTKVQEYFEKIEVLSNDKSLSSKIRFGFKDLIEMRNNNWTARRVEEKAKKLSEIRKGDAVNNQAPPRTGANTPRGSSGFSSGTQDVRQRGGPQDARSAPTDEWETVHTKGKKGRGGGGFSGSSSASSTPTASSGNSNVNKFSALNINTRSSGSVRGGSKNTPSNSSSSSSSKRSTSSKLQVDTASSAAPSPKESPAVTLLPGHDGEVDANTTRRIIAAHDEYYGNLIEDEIVEVLKELVHENGMWKAVYSAMKSVMGKSAGHLEKYQALLPVLYKRGVLTREQAVKGISAFLHEFDDMVIDVPKLAGYFGDIIAHAYVNNVFEGNVRFITTLPDDNDFTISFRMMSVIVHIATTIKTIDSEEKAVEFFKSALDLSSIDKMQKTQLDEAIEKYSAGFLMVE